MNASKAYLVNNAGGGGGGGGGAFWDNPSGKVVVNLDWPNNGMTTVDSQNTGIILAPTPGVWSVYQWQFDGIRVREFYGLRAALTTGFIVFSKIAGTPAARFGTGANNPGFGDFLLSGTNFESFSVPYFAPLDSSDPTSPGFGQGNGDFSTPAVPISILTTGEVVFSMFASATLDRKTVRGVLTISPEIIWPYDLAP